MRILHTLDTNGKINLIVNPPIGREGRQDDSYLRKAAIKKKVPYMTTMAEAKATVSGILSLKKHGSSQVQEKALLTWYSFQKNASLKFPPWQWN